jgi:hypothetical protein
MTSFIRRVSLPAVCLAAVVGGFGCGDALDDDVDDVRSALHPASDVIWTTLSIPVCWINPSAATSAQREEVRLAIVNSWERDSLVRFTGWGPCPTPPVGSTGVRIQINNGFSVMPHTNGIGRFIAQDLQTGMILNLNPVPGSPVCPLGMAPAQCVVGHAVHEFGHALGFDGEDQRSDSPVNCTGLAVGNVLVGPLDPLSVMNHCNPGRLFGALTPGDIEGIQQFYGNPKSVGRRKDVILWDSNTAYFLHGTKYTRYNVLNDQTDDYYPRPIAGNWPGWPDAWKSSVDAIADYSSTKLYMFRDNQYLRYDKNADAVDANYPKTLPGGWRNWPAHWTSVDAAVRWPTDGKLYMFRKDEYIQISSGVTVDAGFPHKISFDWPIPWTTGFDYVIPYPNGNVYFFKGTQYLRYNPVSNRASSPINIVGSWPGVMF